MIVFSKEYPGGNGVEVTAHASDGTIGVAVFRGVEHGKAIERIEIGMADALDMALALLGAIAPDSLVVLDRAHRKGER